MKTFLAGSNFSYWNFNLNICFNINPMGAPSTNLIEIKSMNITWDLINCCRWIDRYPSVPIMRPRNLQRSTSRGDLVVGGLLDAFVRHCHQLSLMNPSGATRQDTHRGFKRCLSITVCNIAWKVTIWETRLQEEVLSPLIRVNSPTTRINYHCSRLEAITISTEIARGHCS